MPAAVLVHIRVHRSWLLPHYSLSSASPVLGQGPSLRAMQVSTLFHRARCMAESQGRGQTGQVGIEEAGTWF